jgi:TDG/mug DNA glycosylase family protein
MSVKQAPPSRAELAAAHGKRVADVLAPGLQVLFCGINPGLYSAAVGHHFARPGNRFWPTLYAAGFSDRLLAPAQEQELLAQGWGITNLVARATASAAELGTDELVRCRLRLQRKVRKHRPRYVAFLGIGAYRIAFARPGALLGAQSEDFAGAGIWVLPNPSGLNAHYQRDELTRLFAELRQAVTSRG